MPPKKATSSPQLEIISYRSSREWRAWLSKNHRSTPGIWMRIFKKGSGHATISYAEALEEALCYGWIDSQKRSYDEMSFLQKFTPRRPKSIWSKVNVAHAERLIASGRMRASGLREVEAAKQDGRWQRAYDSPSKAELPADFMKEVRKDKKALSFLQTLNRANLYSINWRLQTAKRPETRMRRIKTIVAMLSSGKKFHD